MKILYLSSQRLPTEKAYGIQIIKMCEAFSRLDNRLTLLFPNRKNLIKEDLRYYYGISNTFDIVSLKSLDFYWPGPLDKLAFFIKQAISAIKLSRYALKNNFDLIYSRDELPLYFLSFFNIKLVFEAHKFSNRRKIFYNRIKNKKYKIITISSSLKDSFVDFGFDPENIFVAHDGVDLDLFNIEISKEEAREKLNLPKDKRIAMYTGHLFKWKGAHLLPPAADILPDYLFVVIGGTDADIHNYKNLYGNTKNLLILGRKRYKDIPLYLKSADVLVAPNLDNEDLSDYTSPLKIFEYMSSKRPIVASNIKPIREVLNHRNSVLVKPDSKALALGIEEAFSNKEIAGKAFIDSKIYQWKNRAENILNFIS